jgi:hypothetical protein
MENYLLCIAVGIGGIITMLVLISSYLGRIAQALEKQAGENRPSKPTERAG